jgi:hypothetical protein
MMRRSCAAPTARLAVLLACLALAVPGVLGVAAARAPGGVPARAGPQDHACDPVVSRGVEPRGAMMGTSVQVRVTIDYKCNEAHRPVHFVLAVENTAKTAPDSRDGRQLIAHLREGLGLFVKEMDYAHGAQGGMILYHGTVTVNQPIEGGEGGQRALLSAIDRFATTSSQSARAAGEAIVKGTQLLAATPAVTDAMKVLLIVDAGAAHTNADVDALAACQAARDAGMHVAVFALESAGDRLKGCADPISYRGASRDNGEDIPDMLQALGKGFAHSHQLERLSLEETLGPQFEYMQGSGTPVEPEYFGRDLTWSIVPPAPDGGHVFTFRAKVRDGVASEIARVSERAAVMLYYFDTAAIELELPNPEVCIAPPANPAWCNRFFATLTPPVPTRTPPPTAPPTATVADTATPAPSVSPAVPTETPVPTKAPTVVPDRRPIFLPVAAKGAALP